MARMQETLDSGGGPVVDHRRQWRECRYAYPVVSRRSKGLSIGVNLSPDKACNFNCVYCQVDRRGRDAPREIDVRVLHDEVVQAIAAARSGELWLERRFARTRPEMRRLNDVAISGDGEPTCVAGFDLAAAAAADAKRDAGADEAKLVVITNATQLDTEQFARVLPVLKANNGEIWAKLDAGSEERFRQINRPDPEIALADVLAGITRVAREQPVVLQTLLFRLHGRRPSPRDLADYVAAVGGILNAGGRVKLIQLHTIARPPAEPYARALPDDELDAAAETIRAALPAVPVETYHAA